MSHDESTKVKIIEVAIECFGELGYDGTSMRLIAEKSGISKPAIYYYFPDKQHLFQGIVEFVLNSFTNALENIKNKKTDAISKLKEIIVARFQPLSNQSTTRRFLHGMFTNGVKHGMKFDHKNMFEAQENIILAIIQQGIDEGHFRADLNKKSLLYAFIGTINLYTRDNLMNNAAPVNEEQADQIIKQIIQGVGKPAQ
ncbi:TetR/AcrR family transcriptional regulator [bacterium]|nr:TetR/AcrR family transcriptional regulator [bacterium]MBU1064726.1 TetR/AcrR family transcriptional regulator [bacterium]MBU1634326.1 TetR/AcrR family transcriptional regulator [bacterium]MBU1874572.1 TetR/AcrR family transcriptional regulator [bacterium]